MLACADKTCSSILIHCSCASFSFLQAAFPVCFSSSAIYSLQESREGLADLIKQMKAKNAQLQAEVEKIEGISATIDLMSSVSNEAGLRDLAARDEQALKDLPEIPAGEGEESK
jgi:hypothetical protein